MLRGKDTAEGKYSFADGEDKQVNWAKEDPDTHHFFFNLAQLVNIYNNLRVTTGIIQSLEMTVDNVSNVLDSIAHLVKS